MKKYLLIFVIMAMLVIPGIALASNITDALYYGNIQISNNGTDASRVSTIMSLNSTSLIDNFDIDTAFDYVAVRSSGGGDIAFMPGYTDNPWCLWVMSIGASASLNYILYTGQSDLDATKYYFPGDGGMTVSDNDTYLELGDNFTVNYSGFIDTSVSGIVIKKTNAFDIVCSNGNVYSGFISDNSSTQTSGPVYDSVYGGRRSGQKLSGFFGTISSVQFYCSKSGTPTGTVYVNVRAVSDDSLLKTIGSMNVASIGTNTYTFNTAPFTSLYPQDIRIQFEFSGGDSGNNVRISYNTSDTVGGIQTYYNGSTYTDRSDSDARMNITMTKHAPYVSSAVSAAEHRIMVKADGTTQYLYVDDMVTPVDTALLSGASVPPNAYAWQIGDDDTTPYIETANITVNGVLGGSWRWEYGTTFTDLSGKGNHGTPTFRTTSSDPDVTAALISFRPIDTAIPPSYTVTDAPSFITANITTSGQFTTGNVSTTSGPPGFDLIYDLTNQGNTPNIWVFGIIALCMISAGQLFWVWMQRRFGFRSMWPMFATGLLIMGLFVALGGPVKVFDFWMVVFYIVIFICLMVMSRHTEVGGNVSTHGMIGFCAQSWIGLTLINKMLEGTFIGASETAWVNTYAFTQEFKLFNMFSMPVLNLDFWTKGIPSLLRWDYSFFGGNAQLFQYMLYSLTAVVAFIIFGLLIGLLYNFFRGR